MMKGHRALTEHELPKNAENQTALPKFVTPGHGGKFNLFSDLRANRKSKIHIYYGCVRADRNAERHFMSPLQI
jgi:hypothetical protein